MYCISQDGMILIEAKKFSIDPTKGFLRYYRDGEYKFKTDHESEMYCLYADDHYLMGVFDTMEEAKEKLKEVAHEALSGTTMFEF